MVNTDLHHHMMRAMSSDFKFGKNDCVLFTGLYFQRQGVPVFEVIKKYIGISRKNWPKSFSELENVAHSCKFKNVGAMHEFLIDKMGFKKATTPKDGDLILDSDTYRLGLGWHGGGAFLESTSGIVISCKNFEKRWYYDGS